MFKCGNIKLAACGGIWRATAPPKGVNAGPTDTTAGKGDEGRVVDQVLRGGRQPHSEERTAGEGGEKKDVVCIKTCVVAACHVVKDFPRSQSLSLPHPLSPRHSSCTSSSPPPPPPTRPPSHYIQCLVHSTGDDCDNGGCTLPGHIAGRHQATSSTATLVVLVGQQRYGPKDSTQ